MKPKFINIAIDGPAGSGKSTVANEFAKRHPGFIYINTGAMFRTFALYFMENHLAVDDLVKMKKLMDHVDVKLDKDQVYMVIDNTYIKNITNEIKSMDVANYASAIAKLDFIRNKLLLSQRAMAQQNNVVMDGRDVGTVVLPDAQLKIYLDASVDERAMRRLKELKILDPIKVYDYEALKQEISDRDYQDMHRKIAPLTKANDAIEVKTDGMTIQTCCDAIDKLYEKLIK